MNNPSKEVNRLEELKFQHNKVDTLVKRRYTEYASNYEINRFKNHQTMVQRQNPPT